MQKALKPLIYIGFKAFCIQAFEGT